MTLIPLSGATCPQGGGERAEDQRIQQIQQLQDELARCRRDRAASDDQLLDAQQQIERLNEISVGKRLDVVPRVQRIEPAALSGGFDDNGDGIDDCVIIYLSCIDEDGDTVKALGRVHVQLVDLSSPPEQISVGEVELGPRELRKVWYGRVASQHYSIRIPWANDAKRPPAKTITAKVTFMEYLSGRVLEWQGTYTVTGYGSPTTTSAPSGV